MMRGTVIGRQAKLTLEAFGASSAQLVEAMIDTGYNGYLTLPGNVIASLQLRPAGYRRAMLADGSTTVLEVYLGGVVWHGKRRPVLISKTAGLPLIGMAMLQASRLTIDAVDGGEARVEELPGSP